MVIARNGTPVARRVPVVTTSSVADVRGVRAGRVRIADDFDDLPDDIAYVQALPITLEHAAATELLPWHHRDPFDRVLVAQAAIEGAAVVSNDESLRAHDVSLVW